MICFPGSMLLLCAHFYKKNINLKNYAMVFVKSNIPKADQLESVFRRTKHKELRLVNVASQAPNNGCAPRLEIVGLNLRQGCKTKIQSQLAQIHCDHCVDETSTLPTYGSIQGIHKIREL
jgi:hypothetical protein